MSDDEQEPISNEPSVYIGWRDTRRREIIDVLIRSSGMNSFILSMTNDPNKTKNHFERVNWGITPSDMSLYDDYEALYMSNGELASYFNGNDFDFERLLERVY